MAKEAQASKGKQRAGESEWNPYWPPSMGSSGHAYSRLQIHSKPEKKSTGYGVGLPPPASIGFVPPVGSALAMNMMAMGHSRGMMGRSEGNDMSIKSLEIQAAQRKLDSRHEDVFTVLAAYLPTMKPRKETEFDRKPPPLFNTLVKLSYVIDSLASILRNNSIDDALNRKDVYYAALELVKHLGSHPSTAPLITELRYSKKASGGLHAISMDGGKSSLVLSDPKEGQASSITVAMDSIGVQARTIISASAVMPSEFADSQASAQLALCKRVAAVVNKFPTRAQVDLTPSMSRASQSSATRQWLEYRKCQKVEVVNDSLVQPGLLVHPRWHDQWGGYPQPGRMRQLVKEVASMMTSLPDGIFLRVGESRPDHIRAAIIGPAGTPYFGGIFEFVAFAVLLTLTWHQCSNSPRFDILCGMQYPRTPPSVMWRLNPGFQIMNLNLHSDGEGSL